MAIHDNVIGRPIAERWDADGTVWIYARAHAALTAKVPYIAFIGYDGWRTHALWDTTLASISAGAGQGRYKAFIPAAAIASDTDGWGQCGGYCADVVVDKTLTSTVGNSWRWVDATITCSTNASLSAPMVDEYAIAYTSASATTTHNLFLTNRWVMGTT